jgi:hypothetical protein
VLYWERNPDLGRYAVALKGAIVELGNEGTTVFTNTRNVLHRKAKPDIRTKCYIGYFGLAADFVCNAASAQF